MFGCGLCVFIGFVVWLSRWWRLVRLMLLDNVLSFCVWCVWVSSCRLVEVMKFMRCRFVV